MSAPLSLTIAQAQLRKKILQSIPGVEGRGLSTSKDEDKLELHGNDADMSTACSLEWEWSLREQNQQRGN